MGTIELNISRNAHDVHVVDVKAPGIVHWSIRTVQYDIGVEIRWFPTDTSNESSSSSSSTPSITSKIVQPSIRIEADTGSFLCHTNGKLEFHFDNTYSMLRGKTVELKLSKSPLPDAITLASHEYQLLSKAAASDAMDTHLLNILCIEGVHKFFMNDFVGAEKYFEQEKNRVSNRNIFINHRSNHEKSWKKKIILLFLETEHKKKYIHYLLSFSL